MATVTHDYMVEASLQAGKVKDYLRAAETAMGKGEYDKANAYGVMAAGAGALSVSYRLAAKR